MRPQAGLALLAAARPHPFAGLCERRCSCSAPLGAPDAPHPFPQLPAAPGAARGPRRRRHRRRQGARLPHAAVSQQGAHTQSPELRAPCSTRGASVAIVLCAWADVRCRCRCRRSRLSSCCSVCTRCPLSAWRRRTLRARRRRAGAASTASPTLSSPTSSCARRSRSPRRRPSPSRRPTKPPSPQRPETRAQWLRML